MRLKCPGWTECHIAFRLGELAEDRAERWWTINPEETELEVAHELREAITAEALPFLESVESLRGFEEFWERNGGEASRYFLGLLRAQPPSEGEIG
jgi:hypothetical protein